MDALIFDWDGTLADSLAMLYSANVAVMRHFELPFDRDLYRQHFAPDWRLMYARLGVPSERIEEAGAVWRVAFRGGATTELLPGVAETLRDLRARGIGLALVTAGERALVGPQLERLGVTELLPIRVFGDDFEAQKPDPAPLRRALDELGLADRPSDAAYLGDTADDMRMAAKVGVVPIGVSIDMATAGELVDAGASEVVTSVAEWVSVALARGRLGAVAAPRGSDPDAGDVATGEPGSSRGRAPRP